MELVEHSQEQSGRLLQQLEILDLPEDVLHSIFSSLSLIELWPTAGSTSKRLRALVSLNRYWYNFAREANLCCDKLARKGVDREEAFWKGCFLKYCNSGIYSKRVRWHLRSDLLEIYENTSTGAHDRGSYMAERELIRERVLQALRYHGFHRSPSALCTDSCHRIVRFILRLDCQQDLHMQIGYYKEVETMAWLAHCAKWSGQLVLVTLEQQRIHKSGCKRSQRWTFKRLTPEQAASEVADCFQLRTAISDDVSIPKVS